MSSAPPWQGIFSMAAGGSVVNSTITSTVDAYLDVPAVYVGEIQISATGEPTADVFAAGVNAGALAVGGSSATATVSSSVHAWAGGNITADALRINAFNVDDLFAESIAGAGGVITGVGADSEVSNNNTTLVELEDSAVINVGTLELTAEHTQDVDSKADAYALALAAGAGASATNTLTGKSSADIRRPSARLSAGTQRRR